MLLSLFSMQVQIRLPSHIFIAHLFHSILNAEETNNTDYNNMNGKPSHYKFIYG